MADETLMLQLGDPPQEVAIVAILRPPRTDETFMPGARGWAVQLGRDEDEPMDEEQAAAVYAEASKEFGIPLTEWMGSFHLKMEDGRRLVLPDSARVLVGLA